MCDLIVARRIAEQAHMGQTRKNGEPYINHAIRVSEAAANKDGDESAAIVGMLHDVIEDSDQFTFDDLKKAGFSESVRWALSLCTHAKSESYLEYILEIKRYSDCYAGQIAMAVKLSDLEDNLNGAKGTLKDKYEMARYILTKV
jgi:(p)ppGpp synthase/HD superfamily hydrolase